MHLLLLVYFSPTRCIQPHLQTPPSVCLLWWTISIYDVYFRLNSSG